MRAKRNKTDNPKSSMAHGPQSPSNRDSDKVPNRPLAVLKNQQSTDAGGDLIGIADYKSILETLPVAVVRSDSNGRILFANAAAERLLGANLLERNATDLYGPSSERSSMNPKSVKDALKKSKEGQLINVTIPTKLADGRVRDLLSCFLWNKNTDTIDGVIVPGVIELHQSLARITESLAKSQKLDDTLSLITKEARLLCRADRAYVKLYDPNRNVLVFKALSSINRYEKFPEEFSDTHRGMTGYVFRKRKLRRSGDVREEPPDMYYSIFPDTISKVVVPLLYQEPYGKQVCYGVLSVDKTQENQFGIDTEEVLTILAKHAAIAIAQVELFHDVKVSYQDLLEGIRHAQDAIGAGDLLHDGKNLVRDVIHEVEAIQTELSETSFKKGKAKALQNKLDKLRDLNDFLLELLGQLRGRSLDESKYGDNGIIDLRSLALRAMNLIPLGDAHVEISLDCDSTAYEVYGKATRLLLMLYNLITNAVTAIKRSQHSGQKGGKIVISLSPTPGRAGFCRVQISDNGPGLPTLVREFIRRGQQYSGMPGGFGLGLLIVRDTVEELNGTIEVDSKYGKGTRFIIDLPGPGEERKKW